MDKLNSGFSGELCKLTFWYDERVEFFDDIDVLELVGAMVFYLKTDNQFYTKYFLERLYPMVDYERVQTGATRNRLNVLAKI